MALFDFRKKKDTQYLLLTPASNPQPLMGGDSNLATWEVISEEELEKKVEENDLDEEARLFSIDREVAIRFEKTTHLE